MSSLTPYPSIRSPRIIIPITTALFGVLGASTGLYGYLAPGPEPAKVFGILSPSSLEREAHSRQNAFIRTYCVRNIGTSLGLGALLAFWRFSATCQTSPSAAVAVQKVMAILLGSGVVVGLGDSLLLSNFSRSDGLNKEARTLATEKSTGHMVTALPMIALALGWWYL